MRIGSSVFLVTALATALAASACSNPTPDSFNQPITPKDGSGGTSGDNSGNASSGDSTGSDDSTGDPASNAPATQSKTGTSSASSACIAAVASSGTGEHHPGESCGQCHDTMASAHWTVAGTVFGSGGVGLAGATIEVVDASGTKLTLVTGDNGNFYTTSAVQMPLTVRASKCPGDSPMSSKVNAGSCNSCHDATNRITL